MNNAWDSTERLRDCEKAIAEHETRLRALEPSRSTENKGSEGPEKSVDSVRKTKETAMWQLLDWLDDNVYKARVCCQDEELGVAGYGCKKWKYTRHGEECTFSQFIIWLIMKDNDCSGEKWVEEVIESALTSKDAVHEAMQYVLEKQ